MVYNKRYGKIRGGLLSLQIIKEKIV